MGRTICLRELLLGIEGAALFRQLVDCDAGVRRRATSTRMRRLLDRFDDPQSVLGVEVPELDVETGYTAWAPIYDSMENGLIAAEEPLVDVADPRPPGRSGARRCVRHRPARSPARRRRSRHRRRRRHPRDARRRPRPHARTPTSGEGDFAAPAGRRRELRPRDLRACARAPARPVAGDRRDRPSAVRPGGRVVLTDAHPTFVLIQGQAMFPDRRAGWRSCATTRS